MFQPIQTDPPPDQVRRITVVPFLTDGRCVLIDEPGNPALPSPSPIAWISADPAP